MSNFTSTTYPNISYSNTFGQWVSTTNNLVVDHNNFASNNYVKNTGTLYLSDTTLALQASNTTIQGYFQVTGVGSSGYVQNNLRVDGQVYFTNTALGITNTGQANIGGIIYALAPSTGLAVSNNTTMGGYLAVGGNTNISNTLSVTGTTTIGGATTVSNTVSISGTTTVSNNLTVTQNTAITHYLSVGNDISAVNETLTGTLISPAATITSLQGTSANIVTLAGQTISTSGTQYTNILQANSTVNTATATVTGTTYTNILTANTSLNTPKATITTLIDANSAAAYVASLQTTGQLSVGGNFVINGTTVYNSNTFTINAGSSVGQISTFNVNRGSSGANASIRWNELNQYWDLNDVNNSNYYRIHTDEYLTNSLTSTSTSLIPTANAANTLYNYLTSNVSIINSNVATLNTYSYNAYARANLGVISVTSNVNSPVIVTGNTLYPILNLTSSGVTAGAYGNTTVIPTITVDVYGRVTSIANNTVSSTLSTSANTGTGSVSLLNQTLQIVSSNTSLVNVTASGNSFTITPQTSGVTPGTYGSASAIPTVTVDAAGRVQAISTNSVSSTLNTSANTGTGSVNLTNQTLQIVSSNTSLVNVTASGNSFTISHPASGVTPGTYGSATAVPTISVDAAGRVQSVTSTSIAIPLSQVTSGFGTGVVTALGSATNGTSGLVTYNSSTQFTSLGIGTTASGTTGEIRATNNITAYYSSDKKFKENIRPIPNALAMVTQIGGKLYDWTDDYIEKHGGSDDYFMKKSDFGVIAQDLVAAGFEVAVRNRPDGSLAVDYEKLCALAFEAIRELKQEVDELKNK